MAVQNDSEVHFRRVVRRVLVSVLLVFLFAMFLIWRIDNPRAERFRMAVIDKVVPNLEWVLAPVAHVSNMIADAQSYSRIYQQNQELRRELQRMKQFQEAARQLEQKNAKLLDLNNVQLNPKLTYTTGVVMTDSGSPFRQSALINIGRHDGVVDGWAAMDGLGLVGRISGVGKDSSRVLFVTDSSSRIPVEVTPSGRKAILAGDNTAFPPLEFLDGVDQVRAGDRVFTTGDGGVFPTDLLVGAVVITNDGRLRVKLAADYRRLEFLRIIRHLPAAPISEPGRLVGPTLPGQVQVSE
ncbi:rod shape-determining protein MreC [Amylibacter sp. IMCC11727]|uniref:rod shape-determining protein MreC n=1 Tax=Amylibacter sp. IMCC11727 TaxID=3039851 RepID=UPI00244DC3A0|nr:rod shape-determining protein MreC [Amylibacter sp. IMCC11727]WGI23359.1 rod shape-determining protein MreC [Amylibacter sp. IMCC11727]